VPEISFERIFMSHTHTPTHTHKLQLTHTHSGRGILWPGFVCVCVYVCVCVCVCVCMWVWVWVCGCISSEVPLDLDLSRRVHIPIDISSGHVRSLYCLQFNIYTVYLSQSVCSPFGKIGFFEKGISNWYKGLGLFQISSKYADD
jgi:hypothetical protein